jgi:hypothetical protein
VWLRGSSTLLHKTFDLKLRFFRLGRFELSKRRMQKLDATDPTSDFCFQCSLWDVMQPILSAFCRKDGLRPNLPPANLKNRTAVASWVASGGGGAVEVALLIQ